MSAENSQASGLFFSGGSVPAGLPEDGIYPHGQQIGFGVYSAVGQNDAVPELSNIERVAQSGFTLVGPYYHSDWRWRNFGYARDAADTGLRFTYQVRPHSVMQGATHLDRESYLELLTDKQIKLSVIEQIDAVLSDPVVNPTVARWSLMLEELRWWRPQEMRYLRIAQEAIREAEQAAGVASRPFWMYEPNHRRQDELERTGVWQDIVGKGVYMTTRHLPGPQRSGFALWSFDQIVGAAAALGRPSQAFFQLSEDFTDPAIAGDPEMIHRMIRHDVYLGLVRGIQGVQVWSMHEDRPNLTTHNEQFEAYASVAEELTGALNLQRPLLFGERRDDLAINVVSGPSEFVYNHTETESFRYDTLQSLDVTIDGSRYLFLVNSSDAEIGIVVGGLPEPMHVDQLVGTDASASSWADVWFRTELEAHGVSVLKLRPLDGDFNNDGVVNVADYTVWRDHVGDVASNVAQPRASHSVGDAYLSWLGAIAAAGPDAVLIPEPSAAGLAASLVALRALHAYVWIRSLDRR